MLEKMLINLEMDEVIIEVAIYVRVSTDKDSQQHSVEMQINFLKEIIGNHPKLKLYKIYEDAGVTGTNTKHRHGFNQMITDAREGRFNLILVKDVSRFSRDAVDTLQYTRELRDLGIGVYFVDDNINTLDKYAEDYLLMKAMTAQLESSASSKRITRGQDVSMKDGSVFGSGLLGYDFRNGKLEINPEEAKIVETIYHKYAVEQMGTTDIAHYLTENGYRTSRGSTKWLPSSIVKILHNEKYVGDLVQHKTFTIDYLSHHKKQNKDETSFVIIKDDHDAIISRELWDLTQNRLRRNDKHKHKGAGTSNRKVFSGKIKCGECGSSFISHEKKLIDQTKVCRWNCCTAEKEGSKACNVGKLLRNDDALNMVQCALQNLAIDKDEMITSVTNLAFQALQASSKDNPAHLRAEIERTEYKKERIYDDYFNNSISKDDMQFLLKRSDATLDVLQDRLVKAQAAENNFNKEDIKSKVTALLNGEVDNDAFYRTILEKITVYRDRHIELKLNHLTQVFHFKE